MEAATLRETVNFSNNTKAVTPHSLGQVLSGYATKEELEEAIENIPSSGSDSGAIIPRYSSIITLNGFNSYTDDPVTLYKAGSVYQLRGTIKCPNDGGSGAYVFKLFKQHAPLINFTNGQVLLTGTCLLESINSIGQVTDYETINYRMEGYYDSWEEDYYMRFFIYMPRSLYTDDYLRINITWIQYDNTPTQ